jgi:hypothetical protein
MLNYSIAMTRSVYPVVFICVLLLVFPAGVFARQENPTPQPGTAQSSSLGILAPAPGEALQGQVRIVARTGGESFQSSEIAFAYSGDTTGTWFLIDERTQPLDGNTPVEWDTTVITDGEYTLRLLVIGSDGSRQSVEVSGLRVRNYSPVETNTPAPSSASTAGPPQPTSITTGAAPAALETQIQPAAPQPAAPQTALPTPTAAPTAVLAAAPAAPPPNPAALGRDQVLDSIARGVLAALGAFALGGAYWSLRRLGRRSSS